MQVLSNLISNAIDAVGDGGTIRVGLSCVEPLEGKAVQLSVEDDGPGIEPDDREEIFEPFFTTKKTLARALGYGSREKFQRHHGSIEVNSRNGTWTLRLRVSSSTADF